MKKIYGFAALAAALALTSCSNNDEPQGGDGNGVVKTTYFAVNLATPLPTRASQAGDPEEYAVKNVKFVVFDEGKNVVKTIVLTDEQAATIQWGGSSTTGVDQEGGYVVSIEQEGNNMPAYVMTILNHDPAITWGTNKTIDNVRHEVLTSGVYTVRENNEDKDYYTMTNSAYLGSEKVNGVDTDYITYATSLKGKVFETSTATTGNEVNIYVERVSARVDVKKESAFPASTAFEGATDGLSSDTKFNVTLDGVGFIYDPTKVNLIKDIDGVSDTASDGWTDWMESSNFRSHWGIKPTSLTADDYTKIYHNTGASTDKLNTAWKTATAETFYVNENIVAQTNSVNPTYIVVTGNIKVGNGTDNTEVYLLYYNGKYYTEANVKKQLATLANQSGFRYICKESGAVTAWKDVEDDDITITRAMNGTTGLNYGFATISNATKVVDSKTCTLTKDTENVTVPNGGLVLNDASYADKFRVYKYAGGKTYFYKEIMPEVKTNVTRKGVVRNHLYEITLTSISGLGTPMYDISEEIIPRKIDTNEGDNTFNFGATINILDWTKYSQPITW